MKIIPAIVITVCLSLVIYGIYDCKRDIENVAKIKSSFVVESGPERIGYHNIRIIRHIETGKRFIFTERSSSSTLTPLN